MPGKIFESTQRFRSSLGYFMGRENNSSMLMVLKVDPCIIENGEAHKTSKYEIMNREGSNARLVVRRGQEFHLKLIFNREYDSKLDKLSLRFSLDGGRPRFTQDESFVVMRLLNAGEISNSAWQASIHAVDTDTKSMIIRVISPADAFIGKWKIEISTKKYVLSGSTNFGTALPCYIIFNPWCQDDTVFIESEAERHEYVLEETGLIWRGSAKQKRPTVWKFSQFDEDILDCALYLMKYIARIPKDHMNNPIQISRALSAAVNSPDDNGVLEGNWSDDYTGGTPPTKWLGSQKILKNYYDTKKPVKFGQCWVFAGVLGTVCRTLGLPCRVVTNFASAHDTQGNLTIDYFFDSDGNALKELNTDSVWNYHVWNEVWMERPDLGPEYRGWQIIDATPQEVSGKKYKCGPASVVAIKRGEVDKPYDNGFVYAEVNADKVYWRYDGPSKPYKLIRKDMSIVGQFISTKAVGSWEREDITDFYKNQEHSTGDRESTLNALRTVKSAHHQLSQNGEFDDVIFKLKFPEDTVIGKPFSIVLFVGNNNPEKEHKVSIILRVETLHYTGKVGDLVKILRTEKTIKPGENDEVHLDLSWEEYGPKLLNQCAFNAVCLATVKDTEFEYFLQDDFRVLKPKLLIKTKSEAVVNQVLKVTASFINPLPIELREGKFLIQKPGQGPQITINLSKDVSPGDEVSCSFTIIPKFEGEETIAVKFHSMDLDDVNGFFPFTVKPATPKSTITNGVRVSQIF